MKKSKYNRSETMKSAWRTYKYIGKKQGKTFAEVLKAAWMLAKLHVSMAENAAKRQAEEDANAEDLRIARMNRKVEKADYNGYISHEALYGRSFSNGGYVGD